MLRRAHLINVPLASHDSRAKEKREQKLVLLQETPAHVLSSRRVATSSAAIVEKMGPRQRRVYVKRQGRGASRFQSEVSVGAGF